MLPCPPSEPRVSHQGEIILRLLTVNLELTPSLGADGVRGDNCRLACVSAAALGSERSGSDSSGWRVAAPPPAAAVNDTRRRRRLVTDAPAPRVRRPGGWRTDDTHTQGVRHVVTQLCELWIFGSVHITISFLDYLLSCQGIVWNQNGQKSVAFARQDRFYKDMDICMIWVCVWYGYGYDMGICDNSKGC